MTKLEKIKLFEKKIVEKSIKWDEKAKFIDSEIRHFLRDQMNQVLLFIKAREDRVDKVDTSKFKYHSTHGHCTQTCIHPNYFKLNFESYVSDKSVWNERLRLFEKELRKNGFEKTRLILADLTWTNPFECKDCSSDWLQLYVLWR